MSLKERFLSVVRGMFRQRTALLASRTKDDRLPGHGLEVQSAYRLVLKHANDQIVCNLGLARFDGQDCEASGVSADSAANGSGDDFPGLLLDRSEMVWATEGFRIEFVNVLSPRRAGGEPPRLSNHL